ncbi:MAG TPA: hypothetical protein DEQ09_05735 [Bacteroidales bacterium]|nr:hypothetical protein [Bacteroidales bacterium]
MKFIRRALFLIFHEKVYFRIISMSFFILYNSGLLKFFKKFKMHYFVSKLIKKGDTIIDIGANLGYYTNIFSRSTGKDGIVWAVEPVPLYCEILKKNTHRNSNVIVLPYALGDRESVELMGIPGNQPYRHGLTRILKNEKDRNNTSREVEVKTPELLFSNIERIDYIKCDIEGYENKVIPGFIEIIKRDKPIIQIELEPANHKFINDLLIAEGYCSYILVANKLRNINSGEKYKDDIIYIHNKRQDQIMKSLNTHIS